MVDAVLGLSINSAPAKLATADLDKLTSAANRLEPAVKSAGDATSAAASKMGAAGKATDQLYASLGRIEALLVSIDKAVNPLAADFTRFAMSQQQAGTAAATVAANLNIERRALDEMASALARAEARVKSFEDAQRRATTGWSGLKAPTSGTYDRSTANDRATRLLSGLGSSVAAGAVGGAVARGGKASQDTAMIGAQLSDFGVQVASGGGWLMPLIQQGSQLQYQLGDRGLKGAVKALGTGFVELASNPLTLTVAGLAAAGYAAQYFWDKAHEGVETTEQTFERHIETLQRIKGLYGEIANAAAAVNTPATSRASLLADQASTQSSLATSGRSASGGLLKQFIDPESGAGDILPKYDAIAGAIARFSDEARRGVPNFEALREAAAEVYARDPGNRSFELMWKDIDKSTEEGAKLQRQLEQIKGLVKDPLKAFTDRQTLNMDSYLEDKFQREQAAKQATDDYGFGRRDASARTASQRASIAADRARSAAERSGGDPDLAATRASALVMAQAARAAEDYAATRAEASRQSIEQQQAELASAGMSVAAQDRLRKQIELTNEARQHAYDLTGDYNKADLSGIQAQVDAWARLDQQIKQANVAKDAAFDRQQLGRGDSDRSIYSTMHSAGLLDENGEISGAQNERIAQMLRENETVRTLQEGYKGLGRDMSEAIMQGKSPLKALGAGLLDRTQKLVADQTAAAFDSVTNSLISGLFPGAKGLGLGPRDGKSANSALYVEVVNGGAGGAVGNLAGGLLNDNKPGGLSGLLKSGAPASTVAQALGDSEWLKYSNAGATRSQPIDPKLAQAMSFLKDKGIGMEVFSGGQPGIGEGGARTGSTRHDHGNAADVFFSQNGRRLDWNNPQDVPAYQDIVRQAHANGVTGFGAGPGYMQPGSMHIGYGAPGVWGAGGRGANAPGWLRDAYGSPGGPSSANAQPTVLPQIDVKATQQSLDTLKNSAAGSAGGLKGFGQGLGDMSNMMSGIGGILGSVLGGKKNGALGGAIGMFAGNILGSGMKSGGWLSGLFGGGGGGGAQLGSWAPDFAFDEGGYTGPGGQKQPAGVVHKGEVVFSQADIARAGGVGSVEGMRRRGGQLQPVIAPSRSSGPVSIRGGDVIVQGNADEKTMAQLQGAMAANNAKILAEVKRQRENEWRAA